MGRGKVPERPRRQEVSGLGKTAFVEEEVVRENEGNLGHLELAPPCPGLPVGEVH